MKPVALLALAACATLGLHAQSKPLPVLPPGTYHTLREHDSRQWDSGNIVLLDENRYRVTGMADTGAYRTSFTAQRIFFTSGPLHGAFARLAWYRGKPAITLPFAENNHKPLAAATLIAVHQ